VKPSANIPKRQPDSEQDDDEEDDEHDGEFDEDEEEEDDEEDDDQDAGRDTVVIDFDQYSKSAWHTLNTSHYSNLSSSKQYEASWDAFGEVTGCINAIRKKATAQCSYGTKLSALETLRKIAKTILVGTNTLGHEVRKQFQSDDCLIDAMREIAQSMTPEERLRAGANNLDNKGTLLSKLEWVQSEADGYCIEGLDVSDVVALLRGDPEEAE